MERKIHFRSDNISWPYLNTDQRMELPPTPSTPRLLDVTQNNFYFYYFICIYSESFPAYFVPPNTISMFEFDEGIN